MFTAGALINMRKIEEEKDIQLPDNDKVIPMMLVDAQKKLIIYTEDRKPKPMREIHDQTGCNVAGIFIDALERNVGAETRAASAGR